MRNSSRNIRIGIYELIAAAMSIGLVVINIIRSVLVPITVDETGYAPDTSYKKLWLNEMGSANDHMLHSLLRKFFVEHFSTHVFSIVLIAYWRK